MVTNELVIGKLDYMRNGEGDRVRLGPLGGRTRWVEKAYRRVEALSARARCDKGEEGGEEASTNDVISKPTPQGRRSVLSEPQLAPISQ